MDWNSNTKMKYFGTVVMDNELKNAEDRVNKFLKEKGDRVKDILMSSTATRREMPYVSWTIIYED